MTGAIIGAAALAAGGVVASSLINKKAQESANETNIALSREQMAYQTSEREAVQQYNLPSAQRSRYEQAGINPYFAMSQIDAGNAQQQAGVSPAHVEPVTALGDMFKGLGDIPSQMLGNFQGIQQIQAQEEAIKQARIVSQYKGQEKLLEMQNLAADVSVKMSQVDKTSQEYKNLQSQHRKLMNEIKSQEIDLKYLEDYNQSRNKRERNNADLAYWQSVAQQKQSEYQQMVNDAFPALNRAQMQSLQAATAAAYAQANLSDNMSRTEIEKQANLITENQIKVLERDNVKVEQRDRHNLNQANKIYIQAMTSKTRASNNWVQNYSPLAGFASAGVSLVK